MGFSLELNVPVLTVFLQGLVSFFSPCVLPLIPLYMGYLSGGTGRMGEDGKMHYERKKVMLNTLFEKDSAFSRMNGRHIPTSALPLNTATALSRQVG